MRHKVIDVDILCDDDWYDVKYEYTVLLVQNWLYVPIIQLNPASTSGLYYLVNLIIEDI